MVNGQLLQMNKSFGQLKQKQREKITEWMYQAYKKQTEEKLSDEDALQLVFDRIDEAKIWIPDYDIVNRYRAKKHISGSALLRRTCRSISTTRKAS